MIPFVKMEGAGNDYIYVDVLPGRGTDPARLGDLPALARAMSDRHYGVGSDGLILIGPSEKADARMRMFNADGSESAMCGNGIRCIARYLADEGIVTAPELTIETGAGVLHLALRKERGRVVGVRVDMGAPRLERADIPMLGPAGTVVDEPIDITGGVVRITALSMGNPHCVVFVPSVEEAPVTTLGPELENHPRFPERTNVEFVEVIDTRHVRQRTWERGSGETLACGTGASAVCVAGVLTGRTGRVIENDLRGGRLQLEWPEGGAVFMTGPAREVFRGHWAPATA